MPVRIEHLINVLIDDAPTSQAATFDFQGVIAKRISLYVNMVESGSGATVTLTVEISPDDGATLLTYDKLITEAGVDGPVASVVYSATGSDIVSMSAEDVIDYIRVIMTGGSTTSSNKYETDVWLVFAY